MDRRVLAVTAASAGRRLLQLLEENGLKVFVASGAEEAKQKLSSLPSCELLLVDAELPDGSWRDLLEHVIAARKDCEVIVCSRSGDERLWAEVLQCGAFDLIAENCEDREIARVVSCALDSQHIRKFHRPAAALAS